VRFTYSSSSWPKVFLPDKYLMYHALSTLDMQTNKSFSTLCSSDRTSW